MYGDCYIWYLYSYCEERPKSESSLFRRNNKNIGLGKLLFINNIQIFVPFSFIQYTFLWTVGLSHKQMYNPSPQVAQALVWEEITKKEIRSIRGLPWWRSGWESTCQCRGHGFEPWSGKIPHAVEQLGPWATTTEPARLGPVLRNKRGRDSERPAHRDEERPPLATTRESPRTETKTQHRHK